MVGPQLALIHKHQFFTISSRGDTRSPSRSGKGQPHFQQHVASYNNPVTKRTQKPSRTGFH